MTQQNPDYVALLRLLCEELDTTHLFWLLRRLPLFRMKVWRFGHDCRV